VSFTNARTIDRRDAAVASALAGMVVVILGYASGLGLRTSSASPVPAVPEISAAPPSASGSPTKSQDAPSIDTPSHGSATASDQHGTASGSDQHAAEEHTQTTDPHADPTSPHAPAPITPATPEPQPSDPSTTCQPGLLEGLPLAGSAVSSVSSLLTPVLGSPTHQSGLLDCAVGAVLGPTCCSAATRTDSSL
jgi:hypothetical protein